METVLRHDLAVTGTTSAAGGQYRKVKITGEGRIDGIVDCIRLRCVGTSHIYGELKGEEAFVTGTLNVSGNMDLNRLRLKGQLNAGGPVVCKTGSVYGTITARDGMSGEEMRIHGQLVVTEDVEMEYLSVKGGFQIGGLLNAGRLDVRLYQICRAKEVGGETIVVRRGRGLTGWLQAVLFGGAGRLEAELIEGDDVYVEHTTAETVRGNKVEIGPGCDIGKVEYRDGCVRSKQSRVRESLQI
jgi:cytoskeletal protein CcmA (bactofilin family)